MNVLLVNGSPHANGCIATSLSEIAKQLKCNGVTSEVFHIGNKPMQGCMGCGFCKQKPNANGCVCQDEVYTALVEKIKNCDGIIIGAPVYYAGDCDGERTADIANAIRGGYKAANEI